MKIAIVGSRTFEGFDNLVIMNNFIVEKIDTEEVEEVVSGGAVGADSLGRVFAETYNIPIKEFLPDWKLYGKRAGIIRNHDIIKRADIVFAFWDGKSSGTRSSIKIARNLGKELHIYYIEE